MAGAACIGSISYHRDQLHNIDQIDEWFQDVFAVAQQELWKLPIVQLADYLIQSTEEACDRWTPDG